jgi:hypothetical protein
MSWGVSLTGGRMSSLVDHLLEFSSLSQSEESSRPERFVSHRGLVRYSSLHSNTRELLVLRHFGVCTDCYCRSCRCWDGVVLSIGISCVRGRVSARKRRDSSVGIQLGYGLDNGGSRVRFPAGAGNFYLHHRVQNDSGAHPASYPMGTRDSFPGGKAAGA